MREILSYCRSRCLVLQSAKYLIINNETHECIMHVHYLKTVDIQPGFMMLSKKYK